MLENLLLAVDQSEHSCAAEHRRVPGRSILEYAREVGPV